jgi:hypothetical protein
MARELSAEEKESEEGGAKKMLKRKMCIVEGWGKEKKMAGV